MTQVAAALAIDAAFTVLGPSHGMTLSKFEVGSMKTFDRTVEKPTQRVK
jgi:hypothetical protein